MSTYRPSSFGPKNDPRLTRVHASRLIGIEEVAGILGIERAAVDQIRIRDARGRRQSVPMPEPILPKHGAPKTSPMWDVEEVRAWMKMTGRDRRRAEADAAATEDAVAAEAS